MVDAGFKYNLTDIAAAMGRVQLGKVEMFREQRARLAAAYYHAFEGLPLGLPPHAAPGDSHSWHLYIVQIQDGARLDRDAFIEHLKTAGVATSVHYRPLHQMTYWAPLTGGRGFPHADRYFERCVSLPLFMDMREDEQAYVIKTVRSALGA